MVQIKDAYMSVGKPEGSRPFEGPTSRLKDNIKKELKEIRCEDLDQI
jgi:hypothetical protein